MQLRIQASEDVPEETRAALERRLRLTLGRHAAGIERAHVTLFPSEQRPPARCRIRARLRGGGSLAVEDGGDDPGSATAAAAWRLELRLQRHRAAAMERALPPRRVGRRSSG